LEAIGPNERAQRWAQFLATAGADEIILVRASESRIAGKMILEVAERGTLRCSSCFPGAAAS